MEQQQVVTAFRSLTIPQQQAFFKAVSEDMEFATAVRDVAEAAADELATYMSFHNVPLLVT